MSMEMIGWTSSYVFYAMIDYNYGNSCGCGERPSNTYYAADDDYQCVF